MPVHMPVHIAHVFTVAAIVLNESRVFIHVLFFEPVESLCLLLFLKFKTIFACWPSPQ